MLNVQFDVKRMNVLQDIMIGLRDRESAESIQADYETYLQDVECVQRLLMIHELVSGDYDITIEDGQTFLAEYHDLCEEESCSIHPLHDYESGHPARVFIEENRAFQAILYRMRTGLELLELDPALCPEQVARLQEDIFQLGEFHKHYHRKEKLFFPIFERYGQHTSTRLMWRIDDRIRALYQGTKRQIDQLPQIAFSHVMKTYDTFEKEFLDMMYQEEHLILPVLIAVFTDDDWLAIAEESDAFGYALIDVEEKWKRTTIEESIATDDDEFIAIQDKNLPFGGGYLTTKEANLILNNLPLEITFVDKNSMFKYFNTITEAADMMLVRTPTSIGRNVADCHPPKSLKKVMTLVRDLKTKKRHSESMWLKKQGKYVHITYKGLFDEADEFIGVLEYVQDIQPFFDLPTEVKTALSELDSE